jgi:hypothetical protein
LQHSPLIPGYGVKPSYSNSSRAKFVATRNSPTSGLARRFTPRPKCACLGLEFPQNNCGRAFWIANLLPEENQLA